MPYKIANTDLPTRKNGEHTKVYNVWMAMLGRVYRKNRKKDFSYIGCTVCEEWLVLSNFKRWFDENYIEGYVLDKDILIKGNRVYSPDTCCFVPHEINEMIKNINETKKKCGVYKRKYCYIARFGTINRHIGCFNTLETALNAYKEAKEKYIKEVANRYFKEGKITQKVYDALLKYKN